MNDIDAIKSRINIVDIVGEKVKLKKSGPNYFGLCPFHSEKTPSFSVNETIQIFKCFGCGESGDAIGFVMKTENLDFREALETLAEKVGYTLSNKYSKRDGVVKAKAELERLYELNRNASEFFKKKLFSGVGAGAEYASKRNLNPELIEKFGLGYASESYNELTNYLEQLGYTLEEIKKCGLVVEREGKYIDKFRNRLIFTVYDEKGRVCGFSGRYIGKITDSSPPKYLNSPETLLFKKSNLLYGLYQAEKSIRKLKFVILSEGQVNIISSHRVGIENIVASLGTSFTEQHLKLLSRYTNNIYLSFDRDNAGKKAMLRTLEMLFKNDIDCKIVSWDISLGKDPDEVINKNSFYWIESIKSATDPIECLYFDFENKYKTRTMEIDNKFLSMMIELINTHKNQIKKEFYYKFLSSKFGIAETSLKENKKQALSAQTRNSANTKKLNDDREIVYKKYNLYDKVFSLIMQNWQTLKHILFAVERDFMPDKYKELYDFLTIFQDEDDMNIIRENIDEALRSLFDDLLLLHFTIDEHVSTESHLIKLIPNLKMEYKKNLIEEWKKNPDDPELTKNINELLKSK